MTFMKYNNSCLEISSDVLKSIYLSSVRRVKLGGLFLGNFRWTLKDGLHSSPFSGRKPNVMKMNMIKFNYTLQSLLMTVPVIYFYEWCCGEHELLIMMITVHVAF